MMSFCDWLMATAVIMGIGYIVMAVCFDDGKGEDE